ncbi:Uncharacterised protein [Shewanella baltica]|jgi:hypothetical protein|nr:Uncharacterised protein [Shewanella baltica]
MNVQIHPSYFHKIVSSEPFSLMLDVAAASGSRAHMIYVSLALTHKTKLPKTAVIPAIESEIKRRLVMSPVCVAGGDK